MYVLIYWLIASTNLFAATGQVVFADQASCSAALATVTKSWPGDISTAAGVCVAQSSSSPDDVQTTAPGPTVNNNVNVSVNSPAGPSKAAAPAHSAVTAH